MTSPVKTRREGAVLEITLDRPKANATKSMAITALAVSVASKNCAT